MSTATVDHRTEPPPKQAPARNRRRGDKSLRSVEPFTVFSYV